jgi:membrane protease YdiL (CAAX protease family)
MDDTANVQPRFYSPLVTVIITIAIFFVAQLIGGVLIMIIPVALGWSEVKTDSWLSDSSWAQFLFVLFVEIVTLRLTWEFLRRRRVSFTDIGFNKVHAKYVLYALAGFAAYFLIYIGGLIILSALIPNLNLDQEQQLGFDKTATGINLLPIFVSLVILPPLVEEIVARGFLFTGLRAKLPFATAAIITSLLFAAAHLGAAKDGLLWVAGIDTFILSFVMCRLREKTGSLWPSIGVHFLKNGLAFFVLFNIAQYFR